MKWPRSPNSRTSPSSTRGQSSVSSIGAFRPGCDATYVRRKQSTSRRIEVSATLPQPALRGEIEKPPAQLGLRELRLRKVVEHPVPGRGPVRRGHEARVKQPERALVFEVRVPPLIAEQLLPEVGRTKAAPAVVDHCRSLLR